MVVIPHLYVEGGYAVKFIEGHHAVYHASTVVDW
jgi:hypothetical protein